MINLEERDPRFRYLETKVGLIVLVAILGIAAVLVFVGMERDLFTKKFTVHFVTRSATSINPGMPVKLSGFKIGRVDDLELTENGMVRVNSEINRKYQDWLRTGTKARLVKEGLIGEPYIELTMGAGKGAPLGDGDMVSFERRTGMEELVDEAKPALKEIKEIIHYANDPEGDIKTTLNNIRDITGELNKAREDLRESIEESGVLLRESTRLVRTLADSAPAMMEDSARVMEDLRGVTANLGPVVERVDRLSARFDEATEDLPRTADDLSAAVENVRLVTSTLAAETPRIRDLIVDAGETIGDARDIVRGVKGSWPVRLTLPPAEEPELLPLDSYPVRRPADAD